jgi:hypothetical protein
MACYIVSLRKEILNVALLRLGFLCLPSLFRLISHSSRNAYNLLRALGRFVRSITKN